MSDTNAEFNSQPPVENQQVEPEETTPKSSSTEQKDSSFFNTIWTRRSVNKLIGATMLGVVGEKVVGDPRVRALVRSYGKVLDADKPASPETYEELYTRYGERLGVTPEHWKMIAPMIDSGTRTFFDANLEKSLPVIIQSIEQMGLHPSMALDMYAFWGGHQNSDQEHRAKKITSSLGQAIISDIIDDTPVEEPMRQVIDPKNPTDGDYIAQKAAIATDTTGYFKKESIQYAKAIKFAHQHGFLHDTDVNLQLLQSAYTLDDFARLRENEKQRTQNRNTQYDSQFLQNSHDIETYVIEHGQDLETGVQLSSAILRYQQEVIQKMLGNNWNWSQWDAMDDNKKMLFLYINLSCADSNTGVPNTPLFNPKLDSFADVDIIAPQSVHSLANLSNGAILTGRSFDVEQVIQDDHFGLHAYKDFIHQLRAADTPPSH